VQIINAKDMYQIENFRQQWEALLAENEKEENLDDLIRSYEWIDHLTTHKKNDNVYIAIEKSASNKIIGVVPFTLSEFSLKFDLKSHVLRHKELQVIWILGNDLLLSDDEKSYDSFFKMILEEFPKSRGIYFESVKQDQYLWNYLNNSKNLGKQYFTYLPEGKRDYVYLKLPDTYDEYWTHHKCCHKKDTMRKIKKIEEQFGSNNLRCFQSEDTVSSFLNIATAIAKKSWQYEVIGQRINNDRSAIENKKDLARRKIFHSYILYGGDTPIACAVGYCYKGTWTGDEIAFNKDYSKFSPGWVMICSIIENLIEQRFKRINLGVGEGAHKSRVANRKITDCALLLLKKNLQNYILIKDHTGYSLTKRYLKKFSGTSKKSEL
jgi:hypothetical protein